MGRATPVLLVIWLEVQVKATCFGVSVLQDRESLAIVVARAVGEQVPLEPDE